MDFTMLYKIFKTLIYEVFIISIFLFHVSCDNINKPNRNPENQEATDKLEEEERKLEEQRAIQEGERQVTELQWANQQLKNTVCDDIPKLYSTSPNQDLNLNIYHNTDSPYICNTLTCQCANYSGSPSQWVVSINSSTEKSKEKLEKILLETCQSHNPSFTIHSCSQREPIK